VSETVAVFHLCGATTTKTPCQCGCCTQQRSHTVYSVGEALRLQEPRA
jgi:hypothetical protein